MGKKRRLKSAKAKFNAKHSSHPRSRLLAAQCSGTEATAEVDVAPSIENIIETPSTLILTQEPAEPTTTPVIADPPIVAKPTLAKTTENTVPRKKAPAPRKKATTKTRKTTKRATKKKSTAPAT